MAGELVAAQERSKGMSLTKKIIAWGYAPGMTVGALGLGLWVAQTGLPLAWLIAIAVLAIALSFLTERWNAYQPDWNENQGDRTRDIWHACVNESLVCMSVLSLPLIAHIVPSFGIWPSHWPLVVQLVVAIVVADIGITLAHYASHKWTWLWRLHAVHHSVRRMYGFNGLMKHPLHQLIETVAGTTPLVLAGLPVEVAALLGLAISVQLLLQHSNVDMRIGVLKSFWAVALIHRFHHVREEGAGDVNFGLFTTLTDRVLGTTYYDDRMFVSDDLGIAGEPNYPRDYRAQLKKPFEASYGR